MILSFAFQLVNLFEQAVVENLVVGFLDNYSSMPLMRIRWCSFVDFSRVYIQLLLAVITSHDSNRRFHFTFPSCPFKLNRLFNIPSRIVGHRLASYSIQHWNTCYYFFLNRCVLSSAFVNCFISTISVSRIVYFPDCTMSIGAMVLQRFVPLSLLDNATPCSSPL